MLVLAVLGGWLIIDRIGDAGTEPKRQSASDLNDGQRKSRAWLKKEITEGRVPASAPRGTVTRAQLGAAWPLTVESGVLRCEVIERGGQRVQAITIAVAGEIYAVNGPAGGLSIEAIWAPGELVYVRDPQTGQRVNVGPPRRSLSPLIDLGRTLCR
jgi:hypothetical protein